MLLGRYRFRWKSTQVFDISGHRQSSQDNTISKSGKFSDETSKDVTHLVYIVCHLLICKFIDGNFQGFYKIYMGNSVNLEE